MTDPPADTRWDMFVEAVLRVGAVDERRSRYGAKPAVLLDGREIAHREAPGIIDLCITAAGWNQVRNEYGEDPALRRNSRRRDWIELRLHDVADLTDWARCSPLPSPPTPDPSSRSALACNATGTRYQSELPMAHGRSWVSTTVPTGDKPRRILERNTIRSRVDSSAIVICGGGVATVIEDTGLSPLTAISKHSDAEEQVMKSSRRP